jgi:hypothetical protein
MMVTSTFVACVVLFVAGMVQCDNNVDSLPVRRLSDSSSFSYHNIKGSSSSSSSRSKSHGHGKNKYKNGKKKHGHSHSHSHSHKQSKKSSKGHGHSSSKSSSPGDYNGSTQKVSMIMPSNAISNRDIMKIMVYNIAEINGPNLEEMMEYNKIGLKEFTPTEVTPTEVTINEPETEPEKPSERDADEGSVPLSCGGGASSSGSGSGGSQLALEYTYSYAVEFDTTVSSTAEGIALAEERLNSAILLLMCGSSDKIRNRLLKSASVHRQLELLSVASDPQDRESSGT